PLSSPSTPRQGRRAWHLCVGRVPRDFGVSRDEFIAGMSDRGVDCSVHFTPVHAHPYFESLLGPQSLPKADAAFEEIVSLPMYPDLTHDAVDRVVDAIASLAGGARS